MKQPIRLFLFIMITIAILGEWRIALFDHDFRFSLAVIFFAFFLLWRKDISPILLGFSVGGFVVLFRISLDLIQGVAIAESFSVHFPAFFFYLLYSCLFYLFKLKKYRSIVLTGLSLVLIEVTSNLIEFQIRSMISGFQIQASDLQTITFIAFIRSAAAIGCFTFLLYREAKVNEAASKALNEKMLSILSDLSSETMQLENSIRAMRNLTSFSKDTYGKLQNSSFPESKSIASDVLWITCEVHELQKNYERMNAGLQQIMSDKIKADTMNLQEFLEFIISSNQKYSTHLGKNILFSLQIEPNNYDVHILKLLPVFQNLVVNAVESIPREGNIQLKVSKEQDNLTVHIIDNGPGISEQEKSDIFQLGYSTKFKPDGTISTGIGLYYVHQIITELGGTIEVIDTDKGAHMFFQLPWKNVVATL